MSYMFLSSFYFLKVVCKWCVVVFFINVGITIRLYIFVFISTVLHDSYISK